MPLVKPNLWFSIVALAKKSSVNAFAQVSHSGGEEASLSTSGFVNEVLASLDDSSDDARNKSQTAQPTQVSRVCCSLFKKTPEF